MRASLDGDGDLVYVLTDVVRQDSMSVPAAFRCATTALRTLRGPGEALKMDDAEFVSYVYKCLRRYRTTG